MPMSLITFRHVSRVTIDVTDVTHFYDISLSDLVMLTPNDLERVHGICEIIPSYFGTSLWPYFTCALLLDYQNLIAHTHNL